MPTFQTCSVSPESSVNLYATNAMKAVEEDADEGTAEVLVDKSHPAEYIEVPEPPAYAGLLDKIVKMLSKASGRYRGF